MNLSDSYFQSGYFGFSPIGWIVLAMLLIPNLLWMKKNPNAADDETENRTLLACERIGQALVVFSLAAFDNLHPEWNFPHILWLVFAMVLMIAYDVWWIGVFEHQRSLYSGFLFLPIAGALLPSAAFFCLAVYSRLLWMWIGAVLFAIGHLTITWQHAESLKKTDKHAG